MGSLITALYRRFAGLIAEIGKFGVVGAIAAVIDLGGAGYLHGVVGVGPLTSKAISVAVATMASYLGNRFWTFRHRGGHALLREWTVFVLLNIIGLMIAEASIAFTYYVLGLHGHVAYNLASFSGTVLATGFRYWSYKKWVFLAAGPAGDLPEQVPDLAPASAPLASGPAGPDLP